MKRDPRVDPKAGDILAGLNGGRDETRTVLTGTVDGYVRYTRARYGKGTVRGCVSVVTIADWLRWSRRADVIHATD